MPYAIEQKWVGIAKEAVRGTAVTPPTKFLAVMPDSEADYKTALLEDENVRGTFDKYPPQAGVKDGAGKLTGVNVQSDNIGEILNGLLGGHSATHPGALSYVHTFTRQAGIQMPSYTLAIQRGLSAKAYNLTTIKSIALTGAADGKLLADVDFLFQTEAAYPTPTTPIWTSPTPFMFFQTSVKVAGSANTNIKDWTLSIDNGAIAQRTLNQSQDVKDILAISKLLITGGFTIFFEDEIERVKFLANTATSLEFIMTGSLIEAGYSNALDIVLPQVHYTAYPFGNVDGLLGASVAFNAYYNISGGKTISIGLTNTEATY